MKPENNIMRIISTTSREEKKTITKKIQQKLKSFKMSGSHTTIKPRLNEIDGVDYNVIDIKTFEKKSEENFFYEYAKIFDNYYGTLKTNVDEAIKKNDIIFDIDWQGTKQLSKFTKLNLIKIYLIADNKDELKKRLIKSNQNTLKEIEERFN